MADKRPPTDKEEKAVGELCTNLVAHLKSRGTGKLTVPIVSGKCEYRIVIEQLKKSPVFHDRW
jgi:hypothetical protein